MTNCESPFSFVLIGQPEIGSVEREAHEFAALERGRELIHENNGRLCDALYDLEQEIRESLREAGTPWDDARDYARRLVRHTEQCWATRVLT